MRVLIALLALGVAFEYGVAVGVYHVPPFAMLKYAQDSIGAYWSADGERYRGESEVLRFAFTGTLGPGSQLLPPIKSLEGLYEADESMETPVERFYDAYDSLQILSTETIQLDGGITTVLKVRYELGGVEYSAYAYDVVEGGESQKAALIIPGSGVNQSSAIYRRDRSNYHDGILEALGPALRRYVLIKPNEDCIAFHDGKAKLNPDFFVNWLLDRGASYSANYIVNSLAITKYLQHRYHEVIVAGLSQGGLAALLNALQSRPTATIVSSGFSVLDARITWAGYDQIVIPGLQRELPIGAIRDRLKALPTRLLFTWGAREQGPFRVDEHDHLTCNYLSGLTNIECVVHAGGHAFPADVIQEFVHRAL